MRFALPFWIASATAALAHPGHDAGALHWVSDVPHGAVVVLGLLVLVLVVARLRDRLRARPRRRTR